MDCKTYTKDSQQRCSLSTYHSYGTSMGQLFSYYLFQIVSPQKSYKCCDENAKNAEDLVRCNKGINNDNN